MGDYKLLQLLHLLLGKWLKGGIPVLIKESDGAVVGAILATGDFLESGRGDTRAESGALLSQGEPEVCKVAQRLGLEQNATDDVVLVDEQHLQPHLVVVAE